VENTLGSNIINSVEKVLRYLIPGVIFSLLFAISCPEQFDSLFSKISDSEVLVFLSIFTLGISIYVVHHSIIRFTFEQIAYLIGQSPVNEYSDNHCLYNYSKAHAKLIIARKKYSNYPENYYIYLWAIVHYSFIMSWLLFLFSFFHEKTTLLECHVVCFRIIGSIIFFLSICSYFYMQALENV
jgi:hypothetical protein